MHVPKWLSKANEFFSLRILGLITWDLPRKIITGRTYNLTFKDYLQFKSITVYSPYILLTRKHSHLTTYFISIANALLGQKLSYWSHAAIVHGEDVYEALGDGVQVNSLMYAMKSDAAVLLRPKGISEMEWFNVITEARDNIGKPYDTDFDLANDNRLSCIEFVWDALLEVVGYEEKWPAFNKMIKDHGNVTPQMLYDSGDFEIVLEVRK